MTLAILPLSMSSSNLLFPVNASMHISAKSPDSQVLVQTAFNHTARHEATSQLSSLECSSRTEPTTLSSLDSASLTQPDTGEAHQV